MSESGRRKRLAGEGTMKEAERDALQDEIEERALRWVLAFLGGRASIEVTPPPPAPTGSTFHSSWSVRLKTDE